MRQGNTPGVPFHGEFVSADAHAPANEAAARFQIFGASNPVALAVLNANDIVIITDMEISANAPMQVQLFDGADTTIASGELITGVFLAANQTIPLGYSIAHWCQHGSFPKVLTSVAGFVMVNIRGTIWRDGGS